VTDDPFGTEELRRRVLATWRESPARFRADANMEDDLALVGYRDRVLVELAQNAADAATRGGVSGRLILEHDGKVLTATNNGAPLEASGVESISVARASAKVDQVESVGRFGVGFAAVLAVSDAPCIVSATGAVRWSRTDARALAATLPELAHELAARGDRVPVLRLPFGATSTPVVDGVTAVVLPLRDADAVAGVRAQLLGLDPTLLLALPALAEVVIRVDGGERVLRAEQSTDGVVVSDGDQISRWWVTTDSGPLPPDLIDGRPAEERRFDRWQVTWAVPTDSASRITDLPAAVAPVVRAPTAVDDPLTLPAVLIASYPLDSNRRRVTPGRLSDAVTAHAAALLANALAERDPDPSMLRLVPTGLPNGAVDGGLHAAIADRLRETAWLPAAADPEIRQRPRDAMVVAGPLVEVLRDVVPSLLPAGWVGPELTTLGARSPSLAELVDALGAVDAEPSWWRRLYAALDLAVLPGTERDALGALPVALVDGRTVTGPRGLVIPGEATPAADLSAIGIRVVHPEAAHELLRTLGAGDGTPRGLLDQPQVRAAVEASYDDDDPEPVAAAVLALVAAADSDVDELPWLADLALPDHAGEWRPAGELLLPGGRMASMVAPDSPFGLVADDWLERWGAAPLLAVGVLDGPALLREADATGPTYDLDDEPRWWATLPADAAIEEFSAIRDLEQVRDDALPDLVSLLALPPLRSAVVTPTIVTVAGGTRLRVPSYTAWWLSSRPVIDGRAARDLRLADSEPALAGLYDVAPAVYDEEFLRALGVVGSLDDVDPNDVLDRLADPERVVTRAHLRRLDSWLSRQSVDPPEAVRAVRHGEITVVAARDAVVVDAPDLLVLLGNLAVVPVALSRAAALAEHLDLPLASELSAYPVGSEGSRRDDAIVHEALHVTDVDGNNREIAWRVIGDELHVDARNLQVGLGRGRAWRDGCWDERHRRTEELIDPDGGTTRDSEDDLDDDEEG
jgi:hypothetical protein